MKTETILWTVLILFVGFCFYKCEESKVSYYVKITFCDNRQPVYTHVRGLSPPKTADIKTYKEALSHYEGYLNVCEVITLSESK